MIRAICVQSALRGMESEMPSRPRKTESEEIARTLEAARLFVGHEEPVSDEEARVIEEIRRELPRPTEAELKALGAKLAKAKTGAGR